MKKIALTLIVISSFLWACAPDDSSDWDETADSISLPPKTKKMELSDQAVKDIVRKIPSPLELTNIVKGSDIYFSKEMLNSTDNIENYSASYQKALNLGVYAADLEFINIYEKTHLSIAYIEAVRNLADDLKVGHFFDFATLKRLASNSNNIDSLIYISTKGFEEMHDYLNDRSRGNISILVLIGGWLESMYISTNITTFDLTEHFFESCPDLIERIGEQKIVLDDIMILLNAYKKNPGFYELIENFKELTILYEGITLTYAYADPELHETGDVLIVIDKSKTTVNINPQQLEEISSKIKSMRNEVIIQ